MGILGAEIKDSDMLHINIVIASPEFSGLAMTVICFLSIIKLEYNHNTHNYNTMQEALTFDDVLLIPRYSQVLPSEANLETKLSRNIALKLPFISAPMDTVTEHKMATALGLAGGIGIIHKNLPIEEQAHEAMMVRRFENGFITDPITISPDSTIEEVYKIRKEKGYKILPVVGQRRKLLGLITKLDYFWPNDKNKKVKEVMVPLKNLKTASASINLKKANEIIYQEKLSVLCLVDGKGELTAIVTRKDLEKNEEYPFANKDKNKHLRVGAAVGTGDDKIERAEALALAGVSAIVVDTAHGHSKGVIETVKELKKQKFLKDIDIIAGNVGTGEGAKALIVAGVDAVKVGVGPGSICTTRVVSGVGVPQITAVMEAVKAAKASKVPVIADGGIKYSGDAVKALAAGASSVMIGGMFAGTEESLGETEYYQGRMYKSYRGMGSLAAMSKGSKDRYGQKDVKDESKLVPEGIEGRISYRGSVSAIIYQLAGGLRSGMGYLGAKTISEMHGKAKFVKITGAGLKESHPHDVEIAKQAPNYS